MPKMTFKEPREGSMKQQLSDILIYAPWGIIADKYFSKSATWFYQKLSGIDGNMKPTDFSSEEKERLRGALYDIAERLRRLRTASRQIRC